MAGCCGRLLFVCACSTAVRQAAPAAWMCCSAQRRICADLYHGTVCTSGVMGCNYKPCSLQPCSLLVIQLLSQPPTRGLILCNGQCEALNVLRNLRKECHGTGTAMCARHRKQATRVSTALYALCVACHTMPTRCAACSCDSSQDKSKHVVFVGGFKGWMDMCAFCFFVTLQHS
jgi:hypothetical protein